MEQQTTAPLPERRTLSLAEAADAIAQLPDDVLAIGGEDTAAASAAFRDETDSVSGWKQPEQMANEPAEIAEATEPEVESADAGEDDADPLVAVTLPDGEMRELPLSEVVQSYAQAEEHERKAADLTRGHEQLQQVQQQIAGEIERWLVAQAMDAPPSAELVQQDPAEYGRQQAAWQQRAAAREAVLQQYDAAMQQGELQRAAAQTASLEQEKQRLCEAWPEIADPQTGPQLRQDIYHGLLDEYGFTEAELNGLYNHRTVLMARDALAYRRMQKAAPAAREKLREKPVVMTPGTTTGKGYADTGRLAAKRERLRRRGTLRDAAALFEDMDI